MKIPFHLLLGKAQSCLPSFIDKEGVSVVVCDFSPLRVPLQWVKETASELDKREGKVPLIQVCSVHVCIHATHAYTLYMYLCNVYMYFCESYM